MFSCRFVGLQRVVVLARHATIARRERHIGLDAPRTVSAGRDGSSRNGCGRSPHDAEARMMLARVMAALGDALACAVICTMFRTGGRARPKHFSAKDNHT